MKTITSYKLTNKIATVYGGDKIMDSQYCNDNNIAMFKAPSVEHGVYKIFVDDEKTLYRNLPHVYKSDKIDLFELSATIKLHDLKESELKWIYAYIYFNNLTVVKRNGFLVVSAYETIKSLHDGSNLSPLSQHFKRMFKSFDTVYELKYFNNNGIEDQINISNNPNDCIAFLQDYSGKRRTNKIYFAD